MYTHRLTFQPETNFRYYRKQGKPYENRTTPAAGLKWFEQFADDLEKSEPPIIGLQVSWQIFFASSIHIL